MLSIFPLCIGLLDFSLNVLDDRRERVDEGNDFRGFVGQFKECMK